MKFDIAKWRELYDKTQNLAKEKTSIFEKYTETPLSDIDYSKVASINLQIRQLCRMVSIYMNNCGFKMKPVMERNLVGK